MCILGCVRQEPVSEPGLWARSLPRALAAVRLAGEPGWGSPSLTSPVPQPCPCGDPGTKAPSLHPTLPAPAPGCVLSSLHPPLLSGPVPPPQLLKLSQGDRIRWGAGAKRPKPCLWTASCPSEDKVARAADRTG